MGKYVIVILDIIKFQIPSHALPVMRHVTPVIPADAQIVSQITLRQTGNLVCEIADTIIQQVALVVHNVISIVTNAALLKDALNENPKIQRLLG